MASEVKIGQLWKRNTGEYLVVKEIKNESVYFYGDYLSRHGGRRNDENLSHMTMCLNEGVGRYKLIDDVGYTIGMKFRGDHDSIYIIKDFYEKEPGVLCVRYQDRTVGNWDRLPITYMVRIVEEEKQIEKSPSQDSDLYPPADTEPAEGQIWQEFNGDVWLLLKSNNIRLLKCPTKWKDPGFEMEFPWKHFEDKQIWKCLSLATDKYKVGQVWINRQIGVAWTVAKVLEYGRALLHQYGGETTHAFTAPKENWHFIKDAPEEEKKENPEHVHHNVPAVGDIYEWTGSRYPGIFPGKRYTVKVVSEKHKYIVELENLMGTYDFSPHLKTKWKLVYKYGSPVRVGKDYVFEKSTGVWLQSQTRAWWRDSPTVYVFYSEKGEKVEVTENGFQQNVLSGNWTIYSEEEAWTIKSSLKNKLTPCYPKGIDIGFSKIDDLEEIVSKPTKQENKKMNLIEVMDIKDIQIKQVDEEVIKDKQCELAELFGYEAATNSKGEVIFRREGKLSGGIVITPEKLVQLFEKQIKAEASCGSDSILETAIHYGIVESVELALLDEGEDET